MRLHEKAFLKFLSGDDSTLTENAGLSSDEIQAFQNMGAIAQQRGQGIPDYATSYPIANNQVDPYYDPVRLTIGRAAPGNVQRLGNTYVFKDRYDFNPPQQQSNPLKKIGKAVTEGRFVDALGTAARQIYQDQGYDTNIRIPAKIDNKDFTIGGQNYGWELQKVNPQQGYEDIAKQAFSDNRYVPEKENLANYQRMVAQANKGNTSSYQYVPVKKQQLQAKEANNMVNNILAIAGSLFR